MPNVTMSTPAARLAAIFLEISAKRYGGSASTLRANCMHADLFEMCRGRPVRGVYRPETSRSKHSRQTGAGGTRVPHRLRGKNASGGRAMTQPTAEDRTDRIRSEYMAVSAEVKELLASLTDADMNRPTNNPGWS